MIINHRLPFLLLCLVLLSAATYAQNIPLADTSKVIISSVNFNGNKHTKSYIILREMPFRAGSAVSKNEVKENFVLAANQIANTNLFADVKIDSTVLADSSLAVNVTVRERYYIYPTPQFQLVDRSFNEWIKVYNADINRVVYGLKFVHYNLTGRRDQLRIYLLNGYSRNFSAGYSNPFINKALTAGIGVSAGFTQNREVGFKSNYFNKILNYKKAGFVRNSFNAGTVYNIHKGLFYNTSVGFAVSNINVDDSLLTSGYNPHYFNSNNRTQFFTDISIARSYIKVDNNNYPLKGTAWGVSVLKRGLKFTGGINNTTFQATASRFIPHGKNWYSSVQLTGILKLPFEQAYINQRAIGYGSLTLRGLEYYVVDGVAAAVGKYTLSKKVSEFKVKTPVKIKKLPYIPFRIYAKTYADIGYSYIPQQYNTNLSNRLLYTGGFGLDIITFYDIVFKLEYSFNQLGEKGLFLHGKGGF